MDILTDLKIGGQYASAAAASSGASASSGTSFSQVFSAAQQASAGTNYEKYFQQAADTYDVPVGLIKAVAKAESNFDTKAVSRCGAKGIMQLMPSTARSMGVTDAFDPAQNIMGGTKYLRQMLDTFDGDVTKAIAAYNAGPGAIKKNGGMLSSQKGYVSKILKDAGSGVSVRIPESGKTTAGAVTVSSSDLLEQSDVAELVLQSYRATGSFDQEWMRMLIQQMFLQSAREYAGQEGDIGTYI